jgi:hypothetical protein
MAEMSQILPALALAGLHQRHSSDSPAQRVRRLAGLLLGPELAPKVYGLLLEDE